MNAFDPELIVIGGGFAAAGELLLEPAREVMEREALKPMREGCASCAPSSGTSAGMIGAALVALRRADVGLMPLAVCATPIGNLEDVTLRVLRELAEADLVLCEDTRRTRILLDRHGVSARLVELPRAQRGGAHGRGAPAAARRARGSRSSATPACPG